MTVIRRYYCDYCNASHQERDETMEVTTGFEEFVGDDEFPLGWWVVPSKGPNGKDGHACPECYLSRDGVSEDVAERRSRAQRRFMGETDAAAEDGTEEVGAAAPADEPSGGWPSHSSPFGGAGDG